MEYCNAKLLSQNEINIFYDQKKYFICTININWHYGKIIFQRPVKWERMITQIFELHVLMHY